MRPNADQRDVRALFVQVPSLHQTQEIVLRAVVTVRRRAFTPILPSGRRPRLGLLGWAGVGVPGISVPVSTVIRRLWRRTYAGGTDFAIRMACPVLGQTELVRRSIDATGNVFRKGGGGRYSIFQRIRPAKRQATPVDTSMSALLRLPTPQRVSRPRYAEKRSAERHQP